MKISKRKLIKLISESLEKRIAFANDMISLGLTPEKAEAEGILNVHSEWYDGEELQPQGRTLFGDKKAIYVRNSSRKEELFMGAMEAIRAATKRGKIMKQLFRKYADPLFMNQLILIHYVTPEEAVNNINAKKGNYELSAVALLPSDFAKNKIEQLKTGMILDGHITYFANNQDDVYSGKGSDYIQAFSPQKGYEPQIDPDDWYTDDWREKYKAERPYSGSDRTKSSGANKTVANIRNIERFKSPAMSRSNYHRRPGPEHFRQVPGASRGAQQISRGEPPIVLDSEDYLPRFDQYMYSDSAIPANEALVDNWSIKAIILNWGDENEKYKKMFQDAGYKGPIMSFDEAENQKNTLINKGHKN